jgi:hyperosmotically inducible periplasmic protein
MREYPFLFILVISALFLTGCGAAVIGTAVVSTYKGMTDQRSIGTIIDDSVLSANIKTKLTADEFVKVRNVDVDVVNGIVYLIGVVETESTRRMAADIARGIEGVRHVENQLIVGKTSTGQLLSDLFMTSKIKAYFIKDPDIKSLNIDVDTNQSVVTLTGTVGTKSQKKNVISVFKEASNNAKVVDNIIIGN